jgi:hypothetical protein
VSQAASDVSDVVTETDSGSDETLKYDFDYSSVERRTYISNDDIISILLFIKIFLLIELIIGT